MVRLTAMVTVTGMMLGRMQNGVHEDRRGIKSPAGWERLVLIRIEKMSEEK